MMKCFDSWYWEDPEFDEDERDDPRLDPDDLDEQGQRAWEEYERKEGIEGPCTGCENGCDECIDPLMEGYEGCYHKDSEQCDCAEQYRLHEMWVQSSDDSAVCTCRSCQLSPEAQQAMNAFYQMQANEGTWQERERRADFERLAYCGWEEF